MAGGPGDRARGTYLEDSGRDSDAYPSEPAAPLIRRAARNIRAVPLSVVTSGYRRDVRRLASPGISWRLRCHDVDA